MSLICHTVLLSKTNLSDYIILLLEGGYEQ